MTATFNKITPPEALRNLSTDSASENPSLAAPMDYALAAASKNTHKAYQQDIQHFRAWGGLLPTLTEKIVLYLNNYADKLNPRTLTRRLTALKHWHTSQGFSDPTSHPRVRKILKGIKRIHGTPVNQAPALSLDALQLMVDHLRSQKKLAAVRNNALLQLGYFGAFRRSELVAIRWEHITFLTEGIEILIPRSKTDTEGEGQVCAIPYGDETLCPVTALKAWKNRAEPFSSFVFLQTLKGERIKNSPITPDAVNVILKSIAKASQLPDHSMYSGHSLRRGFATEASKNHAPISTIMQHGRWKHAKTVLQYIEAGQRFDANAASMIFQNKNKNTQV